MVSVPQFNSGALLFVLDLMYIFLLKIEESSVEIIREIV